MIDLAGFNHFKAKIEHLNKVISDDSLSDKIAQKGADLAREQYGGTSVQVTVEKDANNAVIVASAPHIAYLEYGTGRIGENSGYPIERLPDSVPITGKWEYYYDSPSKVKTKDGKEGWIWGHAFIEGRPAGMQMLNTAQNLKGEMPEIVKEIMGE